ncbi:MAG TPA: Na/Pi symporter, partial [Terrimicrobiaceae bacterium]|nr:Na/Pi symporter [Terrimicrobiaceae bacterium]
MMVFYQIAGGIALTIFGIRFLRKGLDRLFGGRLVAWLARMTQQRWKAFSSGVVVGTLAPSSTALSLITLQMLNTGQLTAERMLAVLLGANVGITVTVQLLAFHIQDYAGLF